MNLDEYQSRAYGTAVSLTPEHMAFGLLEEAGEVAGIFKRLWRGDLDYMPEWDAEYGLSRYALDKLRGEIGDSLWYLAMLAEVLDMSLDDIAEENLAKLKRRHESATIQGSGDR